MTTGRKVERRQKPSQPPTFPWFGMGLAAVVAGLAIYQVVASHGRIIDHYLVGALVVLALAFAGQAGDRLVERVIERWRR